jgi:putative ABC transport system permease protein
MNDLRYAIRQLLRRPAFAGLAIGTVALAVGATTAIFSVVDSVLFRPLPYPEPSRLVAILNTYPHWREREILSRFWDNIQLSYPEYERLRDENTVYDVVAVHLNNPGTYFGSERPEVISVGAASHTLDDVLRAPPALGRWFDATEDRPGGDPVAVVRDQFWRTRLGADSAALGRTIRIDDQVYTVIGVLPADFRFTNPNSTLTPDVWVPIGRGADQFDEGSHIFTGIGRLAPGVSLTQAQAETETILRGDRSPDVRGARVVSRKEQEVARARPVLLMVLGAVGLILLLACANVGNLLLGRAVERDQEIAVRLALGATRRRLSRLVLVESLVIAVAGGVVGTLLAWWGVGGLVALIPAGVPRLAEVGVDVRVLGFALGVSLLAGLLFGAAPLYAAQRRDVHERLKEGARHTSGRARLQGGLVVAQVSLAVVLLVGSLLLVRSLVAVYDVDVGFERDGLLSFRLDLPPDRYDNAASVTAFYDALAERLRGVPGVTAASATSILPLGGVQSSSSVWPESYGPEDPDRAKPEVQRRVVGVDYFEMLGIELIAGRTFSESDRGDAPLVMVVSRQAVRELWEGRSPIGDRVMWNEQWWTVVGVVEDIRDRRPDTPPQRTVYVPFMQVGNPFRTITMRTAVPPLSLADDVHRVVGELDPLLPVARLQSMNQVMRSATADHRFRALLVSAFGLLAALLAGIGIFGVTAHAVARRTREVGVRVALGATKRDVLQLVLGRVGVLAGIGLALGLAGSVATGRVLQRFLFGVSPTDPATFAVIGALALGLALAAALVPALRAARSDPMEALRYE